jgi:CAF1 family ribonuclease
MDVDSDNFSDAIVSDVARAVAAAEFFSIDLEMSGISFNDIKAPHPTDSIPLRYAKCRAVAKTFGIIQVGLSTFAPDGSCQAWNFFVFPRPVTEGSVRSTPIIALCSAGINFGRSTNINFQRWIDKGITYVDKTIEQELSHQYEDESAMAWYQTGSNAPGQELNPKQHDLLIKELDSIREFVNDESRLEMRISNLRSGAAVKQLLQQVVQEFPFLNLLEQKSGAATDRYLTKKTSAEIVHDRLGFRQVWKLLTGSGKPLVLHNGLLDILFLMQSFESDLPVSYGEFKQSLTTLFPGGIYDTRLISLESSHSLFPTVHNGNFSAALEGLVELVRQDEAYTSIKLDPISSAKYTGNSTYHEAAYDAFVTGAVFKSLVTRLGGFEAVKPWVNTLCVARCYWTFSIGSDGDRLIKDGGSQSKTKTIRYITGLNTSINTRDVAAVFEEITTSIPAITCKSFIDWINDTSALLIVTWSPVDSAADRDALAIQVSSKLVDLVKTAQKGSIASIRIGALDEFIRKQVEFVDNGLSDEPAELQPILKKIRRAQSTTMVIESAEAVAAS